MGSGGLFSLGLAGPMFFLFLGPVTIGLIFSIASILVRFRAKSGPTEGESQSHIDSSIAILFISGLLSILGAILYDHSYSETGTGMVLIFIGIMLLWPVSAVLAIRGSGVGRNLLLLGHGLIALWVSVILLSVIVHG